MCERAPSSTMFLAAISSASSPASRGASGLLGGAAYGNARAGVTSINTWQPADRSVSGVLPLAGINFRVQPLPGLGFPYRDGEAKGMPVGDAGHYWQATGAVGIALGNHVGLLAGYAQAERTCFLKFETAHGPRAFAPLNTSASARTESREADSPSRSPHRTDWRPAKCSAAQTWAYWSD